MIRTHDRIKAGVASHMFENSKVNNVLQHTPTISQDSSAIRTAIEKVMDLTSPEEIRALPNRRVQLGQPSLYAFTYFHHASGRLHDYILPNLYTAFFSGLPDDNLFSCTSWATNSQREEFSRRVRKAQEYYQSHQYNIAL